MNTPTVPSEREAVHQALRRAYSLGQTYWQQADSEYTSQHKKADTTALMFKTLVAETLDALASPPPVQPVALTDSEIDAICGPGRTRRWQFDGRQYDRDTARLIESAIAKQAEAVPVAINEASEITGATVWDAVKAGRILEVAQYCAGDIRATREVHKRLTFA